MYLCVYVYTFSHRHDICHGIPDSESGMYVHMYVCTYVYTFSHRHVLCHRRDFRILSPENGTIFTVEAKDRSVEVPIELEAGMYMCEYMYVCMYV